MKALHIDTQHLADITAVYTPARMVNMPHCKNGVLPDYVHIDKSARSTTGELRHEPAYIPNLHNDTVTLQFTDTVLFVNADKPNLQPALNTHITLTRNGKTENFIDIYKYDTTLLPYIAEQVLRNYNLRLTPHKTEDKFHLLPVT